MSTITFAPTRLGAGIRLRSVVHFGIAMLLALLATMIGSTEVSAQVVQLPTFRSFGVGTTVVVPDRGQAFLGGVTRGQAGSVGRGVPGLGNVPGAGRLFRNRAIGRSTGGSTVSVTATIIDLNELDEAVLAEAARIKEEKVRYAAQRAAEDGRQLLSDEERRKAKFLSRNIGRSRKE